MDARPPEWGYVYGGGGGIPPKAHKKKRGGVHG